jgi:hypothetical protein
VSAHRHVYSDVIKTTEHRAHYDPHEGMLARDIAAQAHRVRLAEPARLSTTQLVGRALRILDAGPVDATAFRAALGLDDDEDDRVAVLAPWCVAYPAETASGWAVWTYAALREVAA